MNQTERIMLEALRECSAVLDQLLNSDTVPGVDVVTKAQNSADAAIALAEAQR